MVGPVWFGALELTPISKQLHSMSSAWIWVERSQPVFRYETSNPFKLFRFHEANCATAPPRETHKLTGHNEIEAASRTPTRLGSTLLRAVGGVHPAVSEDTVDAYHGYSTHTGIGCLILSFNRPGSHDDTAPQSPV